MDPSDNCAFCSALRRICQESNRNAGFRVQRAYYTRLLALLSRDVYPNTGQSLKPWTGLQTLGFYRFMACGCNISFMCVVEVVYSHQKRYLLVARFVHGLSFERAYRG